MGCCSTHRGCFRSARGLRGGWRAAPSWARASAVGGIVYLAVQLFLPGGIGGDAYFGPRYTIEPLVLAAPLLWASYEALEGRARLAAQALLVAGGLLHAVGAAANVSV